MIDGEALSYEATVSWECIPENIEVLIDDTFFLVKGAFTKKMTNESANDRVYREAVDGIWAQFDVDNSGALEKGEARKFLELVLP